MELTDAGTLSLGNLPMVWHALDLLEDEVERANNYATVEMDFTDRKFDEATLTGQRMYIQAFSLIRAARDNQKALEEMLPRGARPHAPWNLVRPSFEASFYAVWMLEPQDQRTRFQRALRIAWDEQRQHRNRLKLMVEIAGAERHPDVQKTEAKDRSIKKRYEEEAHRVGLSAADLGKNPVLTEEIPKLRSLTDLTGVDPKYHTLKWRELSGIQHGDLGAILALSDKQYRLKIPGGSTAVLSLNDDSFVATCYSAAAMQLAAMRLYVSRSTSVSKPA